MDFFTAENLIALLTLVVLEIVLGIDNVIFVAIMAGKLPANQQNKARQLGIGLAVVTRILLLLSINWVMGLTISLVTIFGHGLSGRDLILLIGGVFLIGKSTFEIHEKLETHEHTESRGKQLATLSGVIVQIVIIDIIFSLDSVITAVGISGKLAVMIPAVLVAAGVMLFFAGTVSHFVEKHPTMKMLALSFLILIGTMLVIEGWNSDMAHEMHLKNYAYFAMAFSFLVEMLNIRIRQTEAPLKLKNRPALPERSAATD